MTFEDLLDILAEQFSCDAAELSKDTSFEDLGVDAEDLVELAWQLGEATGTEVEEDRLKQLGTIGEVWKLVRELEEEAEYPLPLCAGVVHRGIFYVLSLSISGAARYNNYI